MFHVFSDIEPGDRHVDQREWKLNRPNKQTKQSLRYLHGLIDTSLLLAHPFFAAHPFSLA